ncbi:MAG TPA: DUF4397 domain-containing protein [Ktedonobacteraceae bacterium]|jgi:hypothetical protein|nr:DUF4397 domain-containing protein [Ktedonobacteraceae bacterium]
MQLRAFIANSLYRVSLALGLFVFALLAGFSQPALADSPAFVRVIHASPHVGTADVFVDGTKVLSNFAFAAVTDYVTIPPGPHKVQIALIGKGPDAAVISQTLAVQSGVSYTVAALGATANDLGLHVFVDDNHVASGQAKLRIYHLAPGIGTISVSNGSNASINSLGYAQASNYLVLSPGSYSFNVTPGQSGTSIPPVSANLKANTVTSIFAVGQLNGNPPFQFITAQVPALPGMPSTGSDPLLNSGTGPSLPIWFWLSGLLGLITVGTLARRFAHTRAKHVS